MANNKSIINAITAIKVTNPVRANKNIMYSMQSPIITKKPIYPIELAIAK